MHLHQFSESKLLPMHWNNPHKTLLSKQISLGESYFLLNSWGFGNTVVHSHLHQRQKHLHMKCRERMYEISLVVISWWGSIPTALTYSSLYNANYCWVKEDFLDFPKHCPHSWNLKPNSLTLLRQESLIITLPHLIIRYLTMNNILFIYEPHLSEINRITNWRNVNPFI